MQRHTHAQRSPPPQQQATVAPCTRIPSANANRIKGVRDKHNFRHRIMYTRPVNRVRIVCRLKALSLVAEALSSRGAASIIAGVHVCTLLPPDVTPYTYTHKASRRRTFPAGTIRSKTPASPSAPKQARLDSGGDDDDIAARTRDTLSILAWLYVLVMCTYYVPAEGDDTDRQRARAANAHARVAFRRTTSANACLSFVTNERTHTRYEYYVRRFGCMCICFCVCMLRNTYWRAKYEFEELQYVF